MIVFTNYNRVKENPDINNIMKNIVSSYKNKGEVKVVDSDTILSLDHVLISPNQKKILNANDFILRSMVDIDIVLNKIINMSSDKVIILTNSWTDIIDSIIKSDNINNFDIGDIKNIFILLNKKIKLYFDLVAESSFKSIIKDELNVKIDTIYFNFNNKVLDTFMKSYLEYPLKYEEEIHNSLIEYMHYQTGYAKHSIFKDNIKMIENENK